MIALNALYAFAETLIDGSSQGDPLFEAVSSRNLRTPVSEADKTVRMDCHQYILDQVAPGREKERERRVQATVQMFCMPADTSLGALNEALDITDAMVVQFSEAMRADPYLGNGVCDSTIQQIRRGTASMGTLYAASFIDVLINQ